MHTKDSKKWMKNEKNASIHTMWISRKKIVLNQEQRKRHLNSQHDVYLCLHSAYIVWSFTHVNNNVSSPSEEEQKTCASHKNMNTASHVHVHVHS